jgi:hypothetical protein
MVGAGEYEKLLIDAYNYPFTDALNGLDGQSTGHLVIIAFVIIGNIGYAISKYRGGKTS